MSLNHLQAQPPIKSVPQCLSLIKQSNDGTKSSRINQSTNHYSIQAQINLDLSNQSINHMMKQIKQAGSFNQSNPVQANQTKPNQPSKSINSVQEQSNHRNTSLFFSNQSINQIRNPNQPFI
jgi:hypothetical protein